MESCVGLLELIDRVPPNRVDRAYRSIQYALSRLDLYWSSYENSSAHRLLDGDS